MADSGDCSRTIDPHRRTTGNEAARRAGVPCKAPASLLYRRRPWLITVTTRPPHLETSLTVFAEGPITANDAFFVRCHLANIPLAVDPASYRLRALGRVNSPLSLSLDDLKRIAEPDEVVAVNPCSGNGLGFPSPRVFGAQWSNGAMGARHLLDYSSRSWSRTQARQSATS